MLEVFFLHRCLKKNSVTRVYELTSVNMQLDGFRKRVLFTDQCPVSFGAITLRHFLSISPCCDNQTMDMHIKIHESYFACVVAAFSLLMLLLKKGVGTVYACDG